MLIEVANLREPNEHISELVELESYEAIGREV